MARQHLFGFGTMSKQLKLSAALSVMLMAAYVLFGQQAATSHAAISGASGITEASAPVIGR
jgi:hypothetical protein